MISKHTRGPWVCHSGMVWKPDGSADGFPIARMDRETGSTIPTERDANAHLIAASPELFDALQLCRELLDNSDVRHYVSSELGEQALLHAALNAARKAIAKATSE